VCERASTSVSTFVINYPLNAGRNLKIYFMNNICVMDGGQRDNDVFVL